MLQYVNNGAIFSIQNRIYVVQPKRQNNFWNETFRTPTEL